MYKYLIHVHINIDAIIHAGSGPNLDLVVKPYATQLCTIWVKLLIMSHWRQETNPLLTCSRKSEFI